jgi:hypothetical protein
MTTKYFNVKQGLTTGNITLDGTTGNITATNGNLGNLATANFFTGDGGLLSNIAGANVSGQVGNALVAGTVYTNAQPNITSVGTLTSLSVSGNVSAGNANLGNVATANYFTGTLTTAAQPNITSVGNLTSLTVGNATSNVVLNNGNIVATGTISANNFSGNFSGNVNVGGTNTTVLFNDNGSIQGSNAFTFNNTSNLITISGNLIASNANLGNAVTANYFIGSGNNLSNIQGANVSGTVANATHASTANTVTNAAQSNITSVGTLTSLDVVGTVTASAFTANTGVFTGNGSGLSSLAGANVTGTVANATHAVSADSANTAGTVTGNAQANITSVGTLTTLSVSGNANVGNLGTTNLVASGTGSFSGNVNMNSYNIVSLATPVNSTDAATKQYVDDVAQGLNVHDSALAATINTLAILTGGTITYNNGTGGVGANLVLSGSPTSTFLSANVFDGNVTAIVGSRILVKSETNQAHNGVYVVTSSTVLTRADDYNSVPEVEAGDFIFVQDGTSYNDTGWVQTSVVTTIGTDPIIFTQFSGAGTYQAGTGLTLNGTQFSISNTAVTAGSYGGGDSVATFTVNSQGQLTAAANTAITANAANLTGNTLSSGIVTSSLTSVGTLSNLAVTGDITSGNVYANSGTIGANLLTGTLTTAAQPNITSVGTLSNLSVSGNVVGGNLVTAGVANVGSLSVTGTSNLGPVGNVTITGGSNGYYLQTNGSGSLSWAAVPSGTGISNGNSNVDIPSANGNINLTAVGNTIMVISGTGANIAGYANVSGNLSAGNIALISSGNISGANNISATTLTGTLTTAAQPNITSVGTLSGLTANSTINFTSASNVSLGPVGNVKITGGSSNQYLQTDGTGNLSWANVDSASLANGNSNINILLNGNITVSSAGNANVLVVTGAGANVTGYLTSSGNITGANANLGNAVTANYFIGSGANLSDIQGANVSGAVANATHANTANTVTTAAQPNITSVGTLTTLVVSGNVTANNVALNSGLTSNRTNVSVSSNTVIDQFAPGTYRTAKYIISASGDDGYQSVETLLIHDGASSYITIYGSICSNNTADIIELSSNINGVSGNVSLYATGTSGNLLVNLVSTYIKT